MPREFCICVSASTIAEAVSRPVAHRDGPFSSPVIWDFWWIKWHWGRFSPSTSVSTANSHCANFSIFINILWRVEVTDKAGSGMDDWIYCTLYVGESNENRKTEIEIGNIAYPML
jgi:hypothetical protein